MIRTGVCGGMRSPAVLDVVRLGARADSGMISGLKGTTPVDWNADLIFSVVKASRCACA